MTKLWSRKLIQGTFLLLAIGSIGIYSVLALVIGQPPSAFEITTDGVFTAAEEWSDVQPVERQFLGFSSFVYTAVDSGRDALYLMYDLPGSTPEFPPATL